MGRTYLPRGAARTMTKDRKNVICFVLPNDRGHFNYTIHIARALDQRGYQIEYFAPAGASAYAPKFAKFTALTEPSDDRFDRFTRLYCNLCSYGDTPEEGNAHLGEHWETSLAKEFPDERGLKGLHGPALVACGGAVATLVKSSFTQEEVVTAIQKALSDPVQARLKEMSESLKAKNALFEVVSEAERAIHSTQS